MKEQAYIKLGDAEIDVEFMGIFQSSRVLEPSPFIGGHSGGVVAAPVAVVKNGGILQEFNVDKVYFKPVEEHAAMEVYANDEKVGEMWNTSKCVRCNRGSEKCTC